MINRLSMDGTTIHVHFLELSLKATKSFTSGGIVVDRNARTITFAKLPAIPLPPNMLVEAGTAVKFQMVGPDGAPRRQTRGVIFSADKKRTEILRIGGQSTTPAKFPKSDGWGITIYKFRAYVTHPGVETTGSIPQWLKDSTARQKALWNRLAWLCRDARRSCSPVPSEQIKKFVEETILPAVDAYNLSLGRHQTKEKIKHPAKLKKEDPGPDGMWSFVRLLRKRIEAGRAVPVGLLDQVTNFASELRIDYKPLNDFFYAIDRIAVREANALVMEKSKAPVVLRPFEFRPVIKSFKAVLKRHRSAKLAWSEGWPIIKYPDATNCDSLALHYYFARAGVESERLVTRRGIPGLKFGAPLSASETGHPKMKGRTSKRSLRVAEISVAGYNKDSWNFKFAVIQHRTLPPGTHVKEWKLLFKRGQLWLCLVVELQRKVVSAGPVAAGLDVGWRRTQNGIRFATLYEPRSNTFCTMDMDMQSSPVDTKIRTPFRIDLGSTRWERRNLAKLLPEVKRGEAFPGGFEMRPLLSARLSALMKEVKASLQERLGESYPAWIDRAGSKGLLKLREDLKDDRIVQEILNDWDSNYTALAGVVSSFFVRSTKRIEYGQMQVAHDICRYLQEKNTNHLIVKTAFIARASQNQDNEDHPSLRRSQKYRQFAAVSKFVQALKIIAPSYGLIVDAVERAYTTLCCHHCGRFNRPSERESSECESCGILVYQDQNAAINLARAGSEPEISKIEV